MFDRRQFISTAVLAAASGAAAHEKPAQEMQYYHDYRILGLSLPVLPGAYLANQQNKEPLIIGHMLYAMGKLKARGVNPITVGELFAADAYYSFIARRFGADRADAFDNDRDGYLVQARTLAGLLKETNVGIHKVDMFEMPADYRASIVVNVGGLYHVSDPLRALEISHNMAQEYLIVQTVVSLANESADYFEAPAPGWTWGSRFSYAFLRREILKRGYKIMDEDRNVLSGNDRPEDRGSAYFLISRR